MAEEQARLNLERELFGESPESKPANNPKRPAESSPAKERLNELKRVRAALERDASNTGASGSEDTTATGKILDAIEALSEKMNRMALKSDVQDLQR